MYHAVQFSGGRTSAFMLRILLDLNRRQLSSNWHVFFENTGKEREETLEFVQEVSERWSIPITWLEYDDYFDVRDFVNSAGDDFNTRSNIKPRYKIVDFQSASRKGEPFIKMLERSKAIREHLKGLDAILPNPAYRMCTAYLKVKTYISHIKDLGWDEWVSYIGIRKDEQRRMARMQMWAQPTETINAPLIELGVTKADVMDFWSEQPFDLKLDPNSDEGNCDLCFLKATGKLIRIMQKDRTREKWWIEVEKTYNETFSRNKLSFQQLASMIDANDPKLQKYLKTDIDKTVDCLCGD